MSVGYQGRFLQTSRQFFNQQRDTVLAALPDLAAKGVTKSLEPLFDMDAEVELLALLFRPIYEDQIVQAGQEALLLIDALGFNQSDPKIARFIKQRSRKVSKSVNKETDKQVRSELAEGIAAGESIEELTARIERVYGAAAGYRAERIARTETIRASSFASIEAWSQSGLVESKEWYTAKDERVCQWCGPMDGKVIGLEGKFFEKGDSYEGSQGGELKLTYESIEGAPLHNNCRCTLLPVVIED